MDKSQKLKDCFNSVKDYFFPKVVGEVNDVFIKVAKIKGDKIPWHNHKNEDELFYIVEGKLLFEVEHQPPFEMSQGDFFIVKSGVNHRVSSKEECKIMLIEPKSTLHTGDNITDITKSIEDQIN